MPFSMSSPRDFLDDADVDWETIKDESIAGVVGEDFLVTPVVNQLGAHGNNDPWARKYMPACTSGSGLRIGIVEQR